MNKDTLKKNSESILLENDTNQNKPIKKTKKSKRFLKEIIDASSLDAHNDEVINIPQKLDSKKNKKRKNILNSVIEKDVLNSEINVPLKKKNKKGKKVKVSKKKQNKDTETDKKNHMASAESTVLKMNESGNSFDSFHSAAGSPHRIHIQAITDTTENLNAFEKSQLLDVDKLDKTFDQTQSKTLSLGINKMLNVTYEKSPDNDTLMGHNDTLNTSKKLDITFDKVEIKDGKSSMISFDATDCSQTPINVTFDKSDENTCYTDSKRISITSDEFKNSNGNASIVLIESSIDTSQLVNEAKNKREDISNTNIDSTTNSSQLPSTTTLKREGTFTKDGPDPIIITSPRSKSVIDDTYTPSKRKIASGPGSTPYHSNGKKMSKVNLKLTHSLEKPNLRKSSLQLMERTTKVMFCSPIDNPIWTNDTKTKVIKSNMKGSNKSFLYEDSGKYSFFLLLLGYYHGMVWYNNTSFLPVPLQFAHLVFFF